MLKGLEAWIKGENFYLSKPRITKQHMINWKNIDIINYSGFTDKEVKDIGRLKIDGHYSFEIRSQLKNIEKIISNNHALTTKQGKGRIKIANERIDGLQGEQFYDDNTYFFLENDNNNLIKTIDLKLNSYLEKNVIHDNTLKEKLYEKFTNMYECTQKYQMGDPLDENCLAILEGTKCIFKFCFNSKGIYI
jgi:hypothetical protein